MPGFPLQGGLGRYVLNPKPNPETKPPPHANRNPRNRGGGVEGWGGSLSQSIHVCTHTSVQYRNMPDKAGKHFGRGDMKAWLSPNTTAKQVGTDPCLQSVMSVWYSCAYCGCAGWAWGPNPSGKSSGPNPEGSASEQTFKEERRDKIWPWILLALGTGRRGTPITFCRHHLCKNTHCCQRCKGMEP